MMPAVSASAAVAPTAAACVPGRVAVVTGSNKGIGYFIALQLALSGQFQHVLLGCRDAARAVQAVERIKAHPGIISSATGMGAGNTTRTVHISWAPLSVGDETSHQQFVQHLQQTLGKVDVLVNNAAIAYKNADPTPFPDQCKPTFRVNFYGTVDLTQRMIPLLLNAPEDPRVITVASTAGRLSQLSPALQAKFSSPTLTMPSLMALVHEYEAAVMQGTHAAQGWSQSNYGVSKLAIIAATHVWAREYSRHSLSGCRIHFFSCCPGYCNTDMTSGLGSREPAEGARNAVLPATLPNDDLPESGSFFSNFKVALW